MAKVTDWPVDSNGNPKKLITARIKDLIPTAKYANVELEGEVIRFVPDTESLEDALKESYDEIENVMKEKRDEILEGVKVE